MHGGQHRCCAKVQSQSCSGIRVFTLADKIDYHLNALGKIWQHDWASRLEALTAAINPLCEKMQNVAEQSVQISLQFAGIILALRWRRNGRDCVLNHQPHDCLLNRLFRRRSKKTSNRRVIGLCAGNSPGTGEFSAQMASYAENVSIWWRHHGFLVCTESKYILLFSPQGNLIAPYVNLITLNFTIIGGIRYHNLMRHLLFVVTTFSILTW